jgi:hypothetical protein
MTSLSSAMLAQQNNGGGLVLGVIVIIELAVVIITIVGLWKIFEKAGEPGWAAIIPIYNFIVMLKIAEKPIWWIILAFIPIISLVPAILVPLAIANNFGKDTLYGIGMIFLPFIFYPLLGFSDAQYIGQGAPVQRGFPVGPPR